MNYAQVKLIHIAAKAAGLITKQGDGRYRVLLAHYKTDQGCLCTSSKQLNNWQVDDFLAICESSGWRHPDLSATYYRDKRDKERDFRYASFAQRQAIDYLRGDLGMNMQQLKLFIDRMTNHRTGEIAELTKRDAYNIIEALKAALSRQDGRSYETLQDIAGQHKHDLNEFCGVVMDDCPI